MRLLADDGQTQVLLYESGEAYPEIGYSYSVPRDKTARWDTVEKAQANLGYQDDPKNWADLTRIKLPTTRIENDNSRFYVLIVTALAVVPRTNEYGEISP